MESSDVASVENVGAEDASVAAPAAETEDAPMAEGDEAPAAEPAAPAVEDAEEARLNGATSEDTPVEESASSEEKKETPVVVAEVESLAEEALVEKPVAVEPTAEEPAEEEEEVEEPAAKEPAAEEPAAEDPAAEEPSAEEPMAVEPAAESPSPRGHKRRASCALSDTSDEFHGFTKPEDVLNDSRSHYSRLVDKMAAEVAADEATLTPVRSVLAPPLLKRQRTDEGSRSSSSLSHRSEDALLSEMGASSPASGRGRRTAPEALASPAFRLPLERGWRRELVYRAALDPHARRNADIYYYTPAGKKLRSNREISEHLAGTGFTLDNFTFFKEPLGIEDPDKEIIRDAKVRDSPQSSPVPAAVAVEGKRTPKPKPPKGVSPEPRASAPMKIKVKSMGSRLSGGRSSTASDKNSSTNNNTPSPWKKPSAPGTPNGDAGGGRRRGRPPGAVDHFTPFCGRARERGYDVVAQIFQYVGMRDLARCARVCRLWRTLAATPGLWRHVRMKNSQVSDWQGLCAALARHGTRRLDLRKMLLPQSDDKFWRQFADNIASVDTLERLELCRCPASAVEAVCRGLSGLRQLGALAVRDARLDPAPLAQLTHLCDLRIKSMSGLTLTSDLTPLVNLKNLQHLSLTSIKELGGAMCGVVVGSLRGLVELELGECTFGAEFGRALARLAALRRLRLERGTADCDAPALLRALATLPLLNTLELVNFDVKPGFDEALAQCSNIQRLLIIPTYVSQSATTNRQVLSGVLRLKDTLTHLMWGVTIELLRVTELFIDQCEGKGAKRSKLDGQSIPVLKPVPGYSAVTEAQQKHSGPPQVEILPLPTLQSLLSTSLPTTKLKLLKIPFHATWRQSLSDFQ